MDRQGDVVWQALAREASSIAEHLGMGATALGKASFERPANYAQAFFALSVGFERGCKLGLSLDEAIKSGRFLAARDLRGYGHHLEQLLRSLSDAVVARGIAHDPLPSSEIHGGIIEVLSEFAANLTRYYNLEVLTGENRAGDPIAAWHMRVTEPVLRAHYQRTERE